MAIKLPTKYLILAIFGLILGIFLLGLYLGVTKERKALNGTILAQNKEIKRLTLELEDKLTYVIKIEQELSTQKDLIKQGVIERETLKKLNIKHVNEISKLKLRIDTLLEDVGHSGQIIDILNSQIANKDSVIANNATTQKAILLPFSFAKRDEWLDLKGNFNSQGKLDISLKLDSTDVNVITGISKKTKEPFCMVTSPNPYLNVINVQSYKTDVPKPKTFAIAVQLGYGLKLAGDPQIAPYVGIGISRNLISF